MADISKVNLLYELNEITNQISLTKKLSFFLGAGTSMALGLPGIESLTNNVVDSLKKENQEIINLLKKDIEGSPTIEDYLNQIRLIREITKEDKNKSYINIDGLTAKNLDIEICNSIYKILIEKENAIMQTPEKTIITKRFFSWLNLLNLSDVLEIFTPNYDLLFESALEELQIPFFDGFVGSNEPFFLPEAIERNSTKNFPPKSWLRIWKIHGSLGWFWKKHKNKFDVVRLGRNVIKPSDSKEIVIYPSKEKYSSSRKQPFLSFLDRLKNSLIESDGLFLISGYSFGDEHINEILFNGLKFNKRLHIVVFLYDDGPLVILREKSKLLLNMTVIGCQLIITNGVVKEIEENDSYDELYWDSENKKIKLGNFELLVNFLVESSGKKRLIDEKINEMINI